jgi:hypothetical protein
MNGGGFASPVSAFRPATYCCTKTITLDKNKIARLTLIAATHWPAIVCGAEHRAVRQAPAIINLGGCCASGRAA